MDTFIQSTIFCSPKPRVGAFVYKNAGKVYFLSLNSQISCSSSGSLIHDAQIVNIEEGRRQTSCFYDGKQLFFFPPSVLATEQPCNTGTTQHNHSSAILAQHREHNQYAVERQLGRQLVALKSDDAHEFITNDISTDKSKKALKCRYDMNCRQLASY